ncbi:MAG: hypothetical protein MJ183_02905 [Treponemataceae bacterium]|nr:hypothetical protein [Treponemataceae bacterium]
MEEKRVIQNFVSDIHNDDYQLNFIDPHYTVQNMICDAGRYKEKLDGNWNFSTDQYDYCLRGKWYEEQYYNEAGLSLPRDYDFDDWETLKVPGTWNTQKAEYLFFEGPGVYTRKFHYVNHGEKKVVIKFGAVYYNARVFINGKFAGFHRGGSTPFYLDATPFLQLENRIIVVAENTRRKTQLPSINTDWYNYGGITRSVELIRLPESYISDFSISLNRGTERTLSGTIEVSGATADTALPGSAHLEIAELGLSADIPLTNGKGLFTIEVPCCSDFELWCPENPRLYTVKVSAGPDTVTDTVGFRTIEVKNGKVVLNGKPVYLNGVACHEESAANGKAVTPAEAEENIRLAKEMGCNFMRLAHYPHDEAVSKLADRIGLLLWEEIPVYWLIAFSNPDTYADAENQLAELIRRDKNRASVIIWSVGNENPDTDERLSFMSRLAQFAHATDPTRLVSAACLVDTVHLKIADRLEQYLDVIGLNEYYGWYNPHFEQLETIMANSQPEKPVVISEFGADALSGHYGTIDQKGTETCQEYIYRRQTELFEKIPFIQGTCPWILFDFRTPRRMSAWQKGRNTKGLLNEDKTHKKLAFYVMQEFYRKRGTTPKE